jgi:hypothetical protein
MKLLKPTKSKQWRLKTNKMGTVSINSFSGMHSSLGNPAIGTAQAGKSMVRNRTRGWLELPDGYAQRYAVPVADTYNTLIIEKDIAHLHVPEHGGQNVSIFIGTYTKVSRYSAGVTIPRFGVWMRPYWSGATWIDAWQELTEIEIVQLTSLSDISTLNFADTSKAADYFKNWIVVFEDYTQAQDTDNYFLIQSSTGTSVTYFGANASLTNATRIAGAKMILCRSFLNKELPATISSYILNYLNEIRITSGNLSTDVSLMGGYRKKTYSWTTSDAAMDRVVLDVGCIDTWRYAILMDSITAQTEASSPLEAGNYSFKLALGTDDNQIGVAREVNIGGNNNMAIKKNVGSVGYKIASDGTYIYRPSATDVRLVNRYLVSDYSFNKDCRAVSAGSSCVFVDMMIMGNTLYYLYLITGGADRLFCVTIDLTTFAVTNTVTIPRYFSPPGIVLDYILSAKMCNDGTYIYIVYSASPVNYGFFACKYNSAMNFLAEFNSYLSCPHPDYIAFIDAICYSASDGYIFVESRHPTQISCFMRLNQALTSATFADGTSTNRIIDSLVAGPDNYLYEVIRENGLTIKKRERIGSFGVSASWTVSNANAGYVSTDGTYLYAFLALTGSCIVMKGIDVYLQTYLSQIIVTNTPNNMIFIGNYLYSDGLILDLSPTSYSITVDGSQRIDFKLLISAGAIPARMRYVYLYVSKDGGLFYRLMKIDLTVVTNIDTGIVTQETWEVAAYYHPTAKHFYHRSITKSIKETDYELIGAEIATDMGRAYAQSGIVRYKAAGVVGVKTYVGNLYDVYSAQTIKNKVLVNCVSGEGNQQIDVFDYTDPIDIEYGDGDEIASIADSNERILVGKKRSNVLLSLSQGEYSREIVSRGVGNCSQKGTVSFDDVVYWPDYNGLHSFSSYGGLRDMNPTWVEAWKAYTDAQKEAAISVIDRINKCWIICVGSDIWQCDLREPNQWMILGYTDLPIAIKQNLEGFIDYLIARTDAITGKVVTIQPSLTLADRFNGVNYSFNWKSNKIELVKNAEGFAIDALVLGTILEYDTSFAFQMKMYLDDIATAVQTVTLPSGKYKITLQAPFGCRCKAPVIEFLGTTVAANDYIKIKSAEIYTDGVQRGDVIIQ